jgi:hypothetical protein
MSLTKDAAPRWTPGGRIPVAPSGASGPGPRRMPEFWKAPAAASVVIGVAFSVLLMAVAFGVQAQIDHLVAQSGPVVGPAHAPVPHLPVHLIHQILLWLTIVITGAMLLQTAISTYTMGTALMRTRRDEIAIRRQSGVLRATLLAEFARAMMGPCLIGGAIGEALGILAGLFLRSATVLPVRFGAVALLSAFPTTILLAICATLVPAWQAANTSPALLRKE